MSPRRPDESDRADSLPAFRSVLPRLIVVIFTVEVLIMVGFALLPRLPNWVATIIDALSLSLLSAPVLWWWIVRPLRLRIEAQTAVDLTSRQAIAASEARQRAVFDTAPDAILVVDERGVIESANRAVTETFGWEPGELVGQRLSVLLPHADRERHESLLRHQLATDDARSLERAMRRVTGRRRDGTPIPIVAHVGQMAIGTSRKFVGVLRDNTETLRAERNLEGKLARLRALHWLTDALAHDASVDEICRGAVAGAREALEADRAAVLLFDGNGVMCFKAWEGLSEAYREGILRERPWDGAVSQADFTQVPDTVATAFPSRVNELLRAEGIGAISIYPVRHEDRLLGFLTMHWNDPHAAGEEEARVGRTIASSVALVLERSRREAEQRQLAKAVDSTEDAVVLTDPAGVILRVNPAFTRITGWSAEEAIGETPRILRSGHTSARVYDELWGTITDGRPWSGRLVDVRKDGSEYHAWLTISPVFDEQQRISAFVGVQRDITSDMEREEELSRGAVCLEEANHELMAAKEAAEAAARAKAEFLATMSHEIRTPMNGVLGFTHLLLDTRLDEFQREYVTVIQNSGQALLGIINDILDFSKIEAGKLELEPLPFGTRRAVHDVVELLRPQAAVKGIGIEASVTAEVPDVLLGDEGRVRQVLTNLVGNAIKFTERGAVRVEVSRRQDAGGGPGVVRIAVTDSGIGIPKERQDELFQSFSQVDRSTTRRFGGTGLGLAISRRLVDKMGGEIGLESEPGRGSTFWFTLPVPAQPVELPAEESRAREGRPAMAPVRSDEQPLRVLVVDDNSVNLKLARHLLEKVGCRVDVAGNGLEAVDMVRRIGFDLVLMDCHMPEMNGLEATRTIRSAEVDRRLPIVALTASAMPEDREQALASGMDDFLSKPLVPDHLYRCLRRWAA